MTSSGLISSVQLLSCVQLFMAPWTAAPQASLPITPGFQNQVFGGLVCPVQDLRIGIPVVRLKFLFLREKSHDFVIPPDGLTLWLL